MNIQSQDRSLHEQGDGTSIVLRKYPYYILLILGCQFNTKK